MAHLEAGTLEKYDFPKDSVNQKCLDRSTNFQRSQERAQTTMPKKLAIKINEWRKKLTTTTNLRNFCLPNQLYKNNLKTLSSKENTANTKPDTRNK